jgi:hypothetical protein
MIVDNAALNKPYPAMKNSPYSILSVWKGEWVFVSCFETEAEARESWSSLLRLLPKYFQGQLLQMALRNRQEIMAREGF